MAALYGTFNQPSMASSEYGSGQLPMWSPSQEILAMSPGGGWEPMLDPNTGQFIGYFQTPDSRDATSQRGMVYNPETGKLGDAQDYAYDYVGGGGLMHPRGFGFMSKAVPLFIGSVLGGLGATQLGLIGSGAPAASGMGSFPAGVGELASFGPEFVGLGTPGILTPGISEATLQTLGQLGVGGAESGGGALAAADAAAINAAGLTDAAPWLSQVGYGGAPPNSGPPAPPGAPPTQPGTTPTGGPASGTNTPGFQIPTDAAGWLKLLGPAILGAGSYFDAKNSEGPQGWQPAMDKFTGPNGLLNRQLTTPTFQTGLMNMPPQRRYY